MTRAAFLSLFFFVFASCGGWQGCQFKSRCGVCFNGYNSKPLVMPESWTPEAIQGVEDRMLAELWKLEKVDPRFNAGKACDALEGWLVNNAEGDTFVDISGREVAGVTYCYAGMMLVGDDVPHMGALAHEMIHAIQNCKPTMPDRDRFEDLDHANWETDGIYATLDEIRRRLRYGEK